jgi:hypothetical protein
VRSFLYRLIAPPMCGLKIKRIASFKATDTYDTETRTITPGIESVVWRTCGRRPGHVGEHGGGSRLARWRLQLANLIYP